MRRALRRPTTLPAASLLKTRPLKPQRLISTSTLLIKNLFLCRGNFSLPFSSCPLHLVISPVPRFDSSCFLRHRPPLVPLPGVVIQPLRFIQSQKETEPVQPPTAPPSEFEIRFGGQGTNLNKSSLLLLLLSSLFLQHLHKTVVKSTFVIFAPHCRSLPVRCWPACVRSPHCHPRPASTLALLVALFLRLKTNYIHPQSPSLSLASSNPSSQTDTFRTPPDQPQSWLRKPSSTRPWAYVPNSALFLSRPHLN